MLEGYATQWVGVVPLHNQPTELQCLSWMSQLAAPSRYRSDRKPALRAESHDGQETTPKAASKTSGAVPAPPNHERAGAASKSEPHSQPSKCIRPV